MSDTLAPVGTATDVPKDKEPGAGRTVVRYLVRFVLLLVFALPLLFMLVSSLKPDAQIFGDLSSINAFCRSATSRWPTTPRFSNGCRSGAS